MLVGQLLGENLGRRRAAGQRSLLVTTCARTHTIATPAPALESGVRRHHHGSCAVQEETGMSSISSKRLSYCRRSVTHAMQASNKSGCCIAV
jgi:hypothetical protein